MDDLNHGLKRLATDLDFAVMDLRGHFRGHGVYAEDAENLAHDEDDPTRWFIDDCIHPNDRGHHEIRRLFYSAIEGTPLP